MKRLGMWLLVLVLLMMPMHALGAEEGIRFLDMAGREIVLDAPAERIVALTPADCEIIFALGAGETLVGRGEYCNYPEEALNAQVVESGAETNVEQIIALDPDVVVMAIMAQTEEQVRMLEEAGIPVAISDAQNIEGVYAAIKMIGQITGKNAEAEALTLEMQGVFAEITANPVGDGSQSVYFEVSPLEYGLWTAGSGNFMDEIATMMGLKNAFADVTGWAEISEEQVIERNPDFIVTVAMYFGDGPTPMEEIQSRPAWQGLNGLSHIFNADNDAITRPGPRLMEAAQALHDFVSNALAE